ncbi:MAG: GNAT family N-acetyltransferase, partial [Ktedonobacteraceae bacterium]|nr:GNAT family N-acetyltransferase [Ktedonobacteraceae bacterium]
MSIVVRPFDKTDFDTTSQIVNAAYHIPTTHAALYRDKLYMHWLLQPDGWFLVDLDDTPVGFGGLIDYGLFARLGMMSVLPEMQRRGIGRALMSHLLAWADARGCPTIVLD